MVKHKILVLTNSIEGLYRFRKELIEDLQRMGYTVFISAPYNTKTNYFNNQNCHMINTVLDRRGTNAISDIRLFVHYKSLLKEINPDVVLTYTIKPNIFGGFACRISSTPYIANVTGLGTAIENGGLLQKGILRLYKSGLKKAACVFFQNESNMKFFESRNIVTGKVELLPGSGVNLSQHRFEEYPDDSGGIRFLYIGRIMKAKGIDELLGAIEIVKNDHPNVHFDIVGPCEEDYESKLLAMENQGLLSYHGAQENVHDFIKNAHALINPSHHEGMSNVLLEAAATGRPVLASNIPGCMEVFEEGKSGFGFHVKDTLDLIKVIDKFIHLPYTKKREMSYLSRNKVMREFDRQVIVNTYCDEIQKLIKLDSQRVGLVIF